MRKNKKTRPAQFEPVFTARLISISDDDPRMVAFRARNGAPFDFKAMFNKAYPKPGPAPKDAL